MSLDDDDNQQEEAIQADMEARDPFAQWEEELEAERVAEIKAEVAEALSEMDLEEQNEAPGQPTTDVSGSSNDIDQDVVETDDDGVSEPEYEARMEARTVVVHDAPPHAPLAGQEAVVAQNWIETVTPGSVPNIQITMPSDDMLKETLASPAVRDALIAGLWPEGYTDSNAEIPIPQDDQARVARVAVTEEMITHQIANTEPWAMAIVAHITAKLGAIAAMASAVGAPWISQFNGLDEDDEKMLESAKGIDPNADSIIQIYLDCIKVARVAG